MATPVPERWIEEPPIVLVVGSGPYALALSQVLGADRIAPDALASGVLPGDSGSYPRALNALERVFVVASPDQSPADLICLHEALWDWVKLLSAAKEEHKLAIQFLLPPSASGDFSRSLAVGLSVPELDSGQTGHAASSIGTGLTSLLSVASGITPMDFVQLCNRRKADQYRSNLLALKNAADETAENRLRAAAARVLASFHDQEYHLDLFCRPPCHRNGNRLRSILAEIVTERVTPSSWNDVSAELSQLLSP